jgi:energy-coupling factor transporter ATP-binding protein EcfA2
MWLQRPKNDSQTIFIFGKSGAGKSTICACLTLFFCEAKGFVPIIRTVDNPIGAKVSRIWRRCLRERRFPPATEPLTFSEVLVGFRDLNGGSGMSFRFLEVAGEDVVKLDPVHPEHRERAARLNDWMDEADAFLVVASGEASDADERYILEGFLDLLGEDDGRPVCLLLAEWDRVGLAAGDAVEFAKVHYGEAARIIGDRGGGLIPFSVGEVSTDGRSIEHLDFEEGTAQLVDWLARELRK